MIPTSKDCVLTTAVWVGDDADMNVLVDPTGEQVTVSLGGNHEILLSERGLERLGAVVADALRRMRSDGQGST
jgi:hypothetical protein